MLWNPITIESWVNSRNNSLNDVRDIVSTIIDDIKLNGDSALFKLTEKFDHQKLSTLKITQDDIDVAYDQVSPKLVEALVEAEAKITQFHELQKSRDLWLDEIEPGVTVGVKTTPLDRVGAYIPGGCASYPSTVLMITIPAKVARVPEIVVCTPPPVNPITLVAIDIAGVTEAYQIGGAQAIAAMAIGTQTIHPVQKIVGPGNVFVTQAKMMLRDYADIDFPAGPSEICVIADSSSNPEYIAADILAQSEHDPNSASILITDDQSIASKVGLTIESQIKTASRSEIIEKSLSHSGYIVVKDLQNEGINIANQIAPEHLSIQTNNPMTVLSGIKHAGSIFIGSYTPVACGDYASGTNHVLPTAGYAKRYSALDVGHFMKRSQVQILTKSGLNTLSNTIETISTAEGLTSHTNSVKIRKK
ncbi:MAG TPA: histidinol dehydrogenase [Methanocorpusculum sp.]|nr:histidinol dehydrogenase [Methanocorpusculum sp.]